jgi:hypothetical protein
MNMHYRFAIKTPAMQDSLAYAGSASNLSPLTIYALGKNSSDNPYCIANELVCTELARFLGLQHPVGAIMRSDRSEIWFATLDFNVTGKRLPPIEPADVAERFSSLSAGIVLFDIFIANSDRHPHNITLDTSRFKARSAANVQRNSTPIIFDNSHALFGHRRGLGIERLEGLKQRLGITGNALYSGGIRHCLLDKLTSDAAMPQWIERIKAVPDFMIENLCKELMLHLHTHVQPDECAVLQDFLRLRRDTIGDIIAQHKEEFSSIKAWKYL